MEQTKIFVNILPTDAVKIRTEVFVVEQGFKEEFDTVDNNCVHFLYYVDDKAIGVARIYNSLEHNMLSIGRFAILKEYRQKGYGRKLYESMERFILDKYGPTKVGLSSQDRAIKFYEALGFKQVGEPYLDENYPHIWMEKEIK